MTKTTSFAIAFLFGLCLLVAPAHAQLARTFVSSLGNDANDCGRLTPCRTFQRAHDQTLALGEITVLDPGGYGAVTITNGISIINDGVGEAGVLVSGGLAGITINAPATHAVTLRGVTIKGIGFGGGRGILFNSGGALTVENCTIRNLDGIGEGITFLGATGVLTVTSTTITDNSQTGINILPIGPGTPAKVTAVIDHVGLYNNGTIGLDVNGGSADGGKVNVTVVDSVAAKNGFGGFEAVSASGKAIATLSLFRSVANSNASPGIRSLGTNSAIVVSASIIQFNGQGWQATGFGQIFSYGDNVVSLNDTEQGPMPLASKQ